MSSAQRRLDGRAQRIGVARVGDGSGQRFAPGRGGQQSPKPRVTTELDLRQLYARPADLFGRSTDIGRTADHQFAVLVAASAIERHIRLLGMLFRHRQGRGDPVADADRMKEAQVLTEIDRARPRQLCAQDRRNQPGLQHALSDNLMKHVRIGIGGIHMGRIDVARDDGEELDVLLRHCAGQACTVADRDLIERPVLDHPIGRGRLDALHGRLPLTQVSRT